MLICGHECSIPCRESCLPCTKPCENLCPHSKCEKVCGEPCNLCFEPCVRKCKHVECTATCGEMCNTMPCTEPCQEKLPCGHECIGFCGDPCPPLCRICNNNELQEIFLGYEEDKGARFVLLIECNHVVESQGMEKWLSDKEVENKTVVLKTCPRCKTILGTTQRYRDYVKDIMNDVIRIKEKSFGTVEENTRKQQELLDLIRITKTSCTCTYSQAGKIKIRYKININKRLYILLYSVLKHLTHSLWTLYRVSQKQV